MNLGLDDVRRSIFAALGLLSACGPLVGTDEGSDAGSGSGSGSDSVDGSATVASAETGPTSTDASGSGSSGDPPPTVFCVDPSPILQSEVAGSLPTGWERCDDGVIHRVALEQCEIPEPVGPACTLQGEQACLTDADCTDGAFGRCIQQSDVFAKQDFCGCVYGCADDSDCAPTEVCACGGDAPDYPGRSQCVAAECASDAACGEDSLCMLGSAEDGCGITYAVACSTPQDQCALDEDCGDLQDCYPDASLGQWTCQNFCCCGRPLLVRGRPVTAPAVGRDDWAAATPVDTAGLPAPVRRRIAEHFTQCAQLEHASVASFARFTLELLALGAPPWLLAAAQRAGLDEIDHAERCFALASAHAGHPVGPGPLEVAGASPAVTLEAVAQAVIDEACVAETLAAVEARAASRHATLPAVRRALEIIAADELRHAELGWQTLRWALELADGPTRARLLVRLRAAVEAAARERPPATIDPDRQWLRAHGVLDSADRRAAHTQALAQVLRPCTTALEASSTARAA